MNKQIKESTMTIKELLESLGYKSFKADTPYFVAKAVNPIGKEVDVLFGLRINEDTNDCVLFISKSKVAALTNNTFLDHYIMYLDFDEYTSIYYKGIDILKDRTKEEAVIYLKLIGAVE